MNYAYYQMHSLKKSLPKCGIVIRFGFDPSLVEGEFTIEFQVI